MRLVSPLVGLLLLLLCSPAVGQMITVQNNAGKPISGAQIQVEFPGAGKTTLIADNAGTARFPEEAIRSSKVVYVSVHEIGFARQTDTLTGSGPWTLKLIPGFSLDDVVLIGQLSPESTERTVHRVRVVDRKKIDALGAVNLRDVLRNELNMRISQDLVLGSSVSLQGLGGQNVKILIDGVPMIGRQNGNIDISQINLNNIERIEIVEGPMAVSFGTDALAGVINLITRKSAGSGVSVLANTYYETVGQYNADARVTVQEGRHSVSASGGRYFFDGWSPNDEFTLLPQSAIADSFRSKPWDMKEQYFGRIDYGLSLDKINLRPYYDHYHEIITNRGLPRGPYGITAFDDTYRTWRQNVGLNSDGQISPKLRYNLVAAYNHFKRIKNTHVIDLTTLEDRLTGTASDQDTSIFNLAMSRGSVSYVPTDERINFQVGYEFNHETAVGVRIDSGQRAQTEIAAFATAEIEPFAWLTLRPGLRATYNSAYEAPLIPSFHTKFRLVTQTEKSLIARASWARGFRAPTLKELYFEFVDINHNILGNQDLQAEYSDNFQLALDGRLVKGRHLFQANVSGYYNDIQNLISLAQIPDSAVFTYFNVGQFRSLGLQGNVRWRWKNLDLDVGGAYIGRSNSLSAEAGVPEFSYTPEFRVNVQYEIPRIKARVGAFYKHTGALPGFVTNDGEITETQIDNFSQMDLNVSKDFWERRITWTVGGKNLFDVQNVNAGLAPGGVHQTNSSTRAVNWGRSIFTSIRFNLATNP
ncbi:MAG: TonB-dependent receptor [Bacteroidota bacterium]